MEEISLSCPFTIAGTEQHQIVSKTNREYRIFVSKPSEDPPPSGYPVIYLLDGNSIFGTVVEAVRIQSRRPEKTGVVPAVVVGIGYPTEVPFSSERFYDYTMAQADESLPLKPDGTAWPEQGGAREFLAFIEEELKPKIHRTYKTDPNKQTIFGHSLGGLFVLYTLFSNHASFQTYIAGSPSIHWNERSILEKEKTFINRLERDEIHANLLIGIGELEKEHKIFKIGEHAKKMSERLSTYKNQGLNVKFIQFEEEGHTSVLPPLINKSLRFSLQSHTESIGK
ncbi:alpha/beta hydrolase [Metabacillus arenae]|uniref:Alpha/beta hydrolase n=1 Tax=Metabacillus arenae TaxID=2771434 RepID=A0A926S021_9BACI|nr:alpha/beta hydrolase [Metabacillus arenae]MBD1382817.1 alpha/beta hydrolase [Metabacillus arenae]